MEGCGWWPLASQQLLLQVRGAACHQGSHWLAAARVRPGRMRAEQTPHLPTPCPSGLAPPGNAAQQGRGLAAHMQAASRALSAPLKTDARSGPAPARSSLSDLLGASYVTCRMSFMATCFVSIRIFPNESVLRFRWPKYWSFSFSISSSNEYSGLISFRMDWLNLLAVPGTLKFSPTSQFKSINSSALSLGQVSHLSDCHCH